jgi:zinc transporter ZupT
MTTIMDEGEEGSGDPVVKPAADVISKSAGLVMVLALAVHAVFEGIAFGLLVDFVQAWQLAVGILLHKGTAVITIGASLASTGYTGKEIFGFLFLFALMAPAGIVIGMTAAGASPLLNIIFMSLSGGTFIYVACTEIVSHEFAKSGYRAGKIVCLLFGIVVISLLWLMEANRESAESEIGSILNKSMIVPKPTIAADFLDKDSKYSLINGQAFIPRQS